MPIKIPNELPAAKTLAEENIFVMSETRAVSQDIRPLKILLLNLMPTKVVTETQFSRLLGNTPLQVELTLMHTKSHQSKNTSEEHLLAFYTTFDQIKDQNFDGMVITGAPVEHLPFEEVEYWDELCQIMEWSKKNVTSTFHICWGAQAALYYHYGVPKHDVPSKVFGIFEHTVVPDKKHKMLLRGFDDTFFAPHSRHTCVLKEDIEKVPALEILAESKEAGVYIVTDKDERRFFITGHSEYDADTLKKEYVRDVNKGLPIEVPVNYFPDDNPENDPLVKWRSHANLLFSNWLNYFVYQTTPYDIKEIK